MHQQAIEIIGVDLGDINAVEWELARGAVAPQIDEYIAANGSKCARCADQDRESRGSPCSQTTGSSPRPDV
jgi:hypothetical protein